MVLAEDISINDHIDEMERKIKRKPNYFDQEILMTATYAKNLFNHAAQ